MCYKRKLNVIKNALRNSGTVIKKKINNWSPKSQNLLLRIVMVDKANFQY